MHWAPQRLWLSLAIMLAVAFAACTTVDTAVDSSRCQYTETVTTYKNTVGITHESGIPLGAKSVKVDDFVTGTAGAGERCKYSFSLENEEDVPLKLNVRYFVEGSVEGGEAEKFLLVNLDPHEKETIVQTHELKEAGSCGAQNGTFKVRFLDAHYIPRTERVDEIRCRQCGGVPCKNNGAPCADDAECGSQHCVRGVCAIAPARAS